MAKENSKPTSASQLRGFEKRKEDHIKWALDSRTQGIGQSGLVRVELQHSAFPELDFQDVNPRQELFSGAVLSRLEAIGVASRNPSFATPAFVSSMTAGHSGSTGINSRLARVCEKRNWLLGVGSQRRELFEPAASREWTEIRRQCPRVHFLGNLGLSQVIQTKPEEIERLVEALGAVALIVHTNPLQEVIQPEGTPQFRGGLKALARLTRRLPCPVVVKEVGCGFSAADVKALFDTGIAALDVSGRGGTHWGRVEGYRAPGGSVWADAAQTFADWGHETLLTLRRAVKAQPPFDVWASGGVRSGLDVAKLVALGARFVGLAQPVMAAAVESEEAIERLFERIEYEFRVALFCTGSATVADLQETRRWRMRRTVI
jgi:isopentenyl-diphosphate delta-isomerase